MKRCNFWNRCINQFKSQAAKTSPICLPKLIITRLVIRVCCSYWSCIHMCNFWPQNGVICALIMKAQMHLYLYSTANILVIVTMGLHTTKQNSLKCSNVCSIYTLSCWSLERHTYAIMCKRREEGLVPSSPLHMQN